VNESAIPLIRRSLGLGEREEALVREVAPRFAGEVPGWVEAFYVRLVVDPIAMSLLKDEASVIRLKRSLSAWFLELFSPPYDTAYERVRAEIGKTHVRIGMSQHLMVTAMGGVRRDVLDSVSRIYVGKPDLGRRVFKVVDMVFDLELALMLDQYRRRSRELVHESDRAAFTERLARQLASNTRSAIDAALCHAELVRRARSDGERERWCLELDEALKAIGRLGQRTAAAIPSGEKGLEVVALADLCSRALLNVSVPTHSSVVIGVEPPDVRGRVVVATLVLALEALLQYAVNLAPVQRVGLSIRVDGRDAVIECVSPASAAFAIGRGDDAFGDLVESTGIGQAEAAAVIHGGTVERFMPSSGGAGVRLRLPQVLDFEEMMDADLARDSRRSAS
jgi:hypothetical protein